MNIDRTLLAQCLNQQRAAQKQLYEELLPYLNAICSRYLIHETDRKDVLQESFIRIFTKLDQFDPKQASLKTWSTRITINCCLKKVNRLQTRSTEELNEDIHDTSVQPKILSQFNQEELIQWLKTMPSDYYEVFNLYVIDGFSHTEISKLLGIKESLSRQRLSRGRSWIKKRVGSIFSLISAIQLV